jgi:hypothetical protein
VDGRLRAVAEELWSYVLVSEPEEYSSLQSYGQTQAGDRLMKIKQFLPLALLAAADGEIRSKTRLQKLAFLAGQRLQDDYGVEPHEFVPYDYGPFSEELLEDVEALEADGLVEIRERRTFGGDERYDYRLTTRGRETYRENRPNTDWEPGDGPENGSERLDCVDHVTDEVVRDFGRMPLSSLIDHVYDEHPEYAENSVFY